MCLRDIMHVCIECDSCFYMYFFIRERRQEYIRTQSQEETSSRRIMHKRREVKQARALISIEHHRWPAGSRKNVAK